jgi:glycosyltransferase involved in cell wall biosynthesis
VQLSSERWVILRALAAAIEPWGDVTHVFGGLESWHLLRSLGRRPILLTVALQGRPAASQLVDKVAAFAAESTPIVRELRAAGVPGDRIHLVYPGIDLTQFTPKPMPASRFRILFASSPADPAEFDARGIPLLIEAARLCPETEFLFVWRQWGRQSEADRAFAALRPPSNVTIVKRDYENMAAVYHDVHAVACLYAPGFGKSAPNSIIEGLACGRPALVASECGLADVIQRAGAGSVVDRNVSALAHGIAELHAHHADYSLAARRLAEESFDVCRFQSRYAAIREALCGASPAAGDVVSVANRHR